MCLDCKVGLGSTLVAKTRAIILFMFPQVTTPNIKKKVAEGYHNLLPEWKLLIWSNLCAHNKRSAGKIVWAIHQMREISFLLQFWNRVLGWGQHVTNHHLITSSQWENLVSSNFRIIDAKFTRVYIHQNCLWAKKIESEGSMAWLSHVL